MSTSDPITSSNIFNQRMENHRSYINRQWQYFATYLVLNGLLINAIKDLVSDYPLVVTGLGLATVGTSAVFIHLIAWTNMRIRRNAQQINELVKQNIIEVPKAIEGISFWLLATITLFTISWFIWLYYIGPVEVFTAVLLFLTISGFSILDSIRREKRGFQKIIKTG